MGDPRIDDRSRTPTHADEPPDAAHLVVLVGSRPFRPLRLLRPRSAWSGGPPRTRGFRINHLDDNRRLLRARDLIDRCYADALDIEAMARSVHLSRAHFIRSFRSTFGETPHRYLQRRRIERAMALLRDTDRPITEICLDVGFVSLGSFSKTFTEIVGSSPTAYRGRTGGGARSRVPSCAARAWDRPSSTFREAERVGRG